MTESPLEKALYTNLEAAETHAHRLTYAKDRIKSRLPISGKVLKALPDEEVAIFELFTSRFAKLQDALGGKLFTLALDFASDPSPRTTFLDTLNIMEKLRCVSDRHIWLSLREIRHHISHEYPNNYDDLAYYLNKAIELSDFLLDTLERIKGFIADTAKKRG